MLAVILLALVATGCAASDKDRLESEAARLVPKTAERQGECDWASGFVENAPAALSCRYFVRGDVPTWAKLAQDRLRDRGYSIQVVSLPPDAPTSWLANGLQPERHVSVGLVSPGHALDWQLGSLTVPSGYVGLYVRVSERE